MVGALLYPLLQTARARSWCEFAGAHSPLFMRAGALRRSGDLT